MVGAALPSAVPKPAAAGPEPAAAAGYLVFVVFSGVHYFAFIDLPQQLQEAENCDAGLVELLMLPLAAIPVLVTPRRYD